MAKFDPELAEIRFGTGLSPGGAHPSSADAIMARVTGSDTAASDYPIPTFGSVRAQLYDDGAIGKAARKGSEQARQDAQQKLRQRMRTEQGNWFRAMLLRRVTSKDGFRERLTAFWADHFTAVGKVNILRMMNAPYVEEAIRPNVTGRFADMLKAVIRHPVMLVYLDQLQSVGPNSMAAKRRNRLTGLNENLARELLELHTLGVDGPYTQTDVREVANLLTGLSFDEQRGFVFRAPMAEPGAETILGKRYGGGQPSIADIDDMLEDLALHPATAYHIATKLAVHFVADQPDAGLVDALRDSYAATGGNLAAVYETLLAHPAAWDPEPGNVKQPIDFVTSSIRALGVTENRLKAAPVRHLHGGLALPMVMMGQAWENPLGPDGWPEDDGEWITPQRLAARLQWAMIIAPQLTPELPDPRAFVHTALGARAPEAVIFAATAAESREVGIGLVLASSAFQRM